MTESAPYGDTGIRALFDDAGDFGRALTGTSVSKTLTDSADPIGKIVAQYAGQLALDSVLGSQKPEVLAGVLSLANDQLLIDLDKTRWTSSGYNPNAKILGRDDLIKIILSDGGASVSDFSEALQRLWNDPTGSRIDRIVVQTKEEAFTGSMPDRPSGAAETASRFL